MFKIKPIPIVRYEKTWHTCSHCQVGFSTLHRGEWHLEYCTPYLKSLDGSRYRCKSSQFTLGIYDAYSEKEDIAFDQSTPLNATNANMENPSTKQKWLPKLQQWRHRAGDCSVLVKLFNRF